MSHLIDTIRALDYGAFGEDADSALREVVEAVANTGKAGSLTITLKVSANGETAAVVVGEIKNKVPELPRPKSVFYIGPGSTLTRREPEGAGSLALMPVDSPIAKAGG